MSAPSMSARYVALVRALIPRPHTVNGDAAAEQRLAASLLDERATFWDFMAARTRFVDEAVLDALRTGIRQVVLIGAGYDGRAMRFRSSGVTFFELDLPATQRDKQARMDRLGIDTDGVTFVPVDLSGTGLDGALRAAGFDERAPSLFVCEGVLLYLKGEAVERTLRGAAVMAYAGSVLVATFALGAGADGDSRSGETRRTFYRPSEIPVLLERTGWRDPATTHAGGAEDATAIASFVRASVASQVPVVL